MQQTALNTFLKTSLNTELVITILKGITILAACSSDKIDHMDDSDMYRIKQTTTIELSKVKISNSNAFTLDESTGGAANKNGIPATPEGGADKQLHRILETDSEVSETDNEIDSDEADNGTDYNRASRMTSDNNTEKLLNRTSRSQSNAGSSSHETATAATSNKKSDGIYLSGAKITAYATSIF